MLAAEVRDHLRAAFDGLPERQRIVVTQGRTGHRLFLNGNLQFAERDEYRYHEALVHPAMAAHGAPKKVAVLREILKYPSVESVTLVELDPAMTRLFTDNATLARLNGHALRSPKVQVVNTDAFQWLQDGQSRAAGSPQGASAPQGDSEPRAAGSVGAQDTFDVIVVDFPDPTNFAIGKLYTNSFYALLDRRLAASRVSGPRCRPSSRSACRRRPTTPMCPVLANGALCWPATGLGACPRRCPAGCSF